MDRRKGRQSSAKVERPLRGRKVIRGGLGRAVRPCSQPALWSLAGTEPRTRPDRPVRAPEADVETSSLGGHGSRRPPAGASRRDSPAAVRQARKRAANRWTMVARGVAGRRRQPGFPGRERRATPGVRSFISYSSAKR
ncbi:hypothetical protein AArcS_1849 [Natranaeroarchaeum sulfidigenes]|uniref:Uncharacterized protein n=1 Tax=Natranaeroarchaeum sulfidigenes TaxID=2784880 RepID=A0A897MSP5_9EURY|nr:hypothetical protein AArcS_1849 [Natranaeroarchaeum sulfidigenes]